MSQTNYGFSKVVNLGYEEAIEKVTEEFDKLKTKLLNKFKVKINDIVTPAETYLEELKTELNVKVYENKI